MRLDQHVGGNLGDDISFCKICVNQQLAAKKLYNVCVDGKTVGFVARVLGIKHDILGSYTHSDGMSARKSALALVKKSNRHLVEIVYKLNVGGIKIDIIDIAKLITTSLTIFLFFTSSA